jgi:hypothetical protein
VCIPALLRSAHPSEQTQILESLETDERAAEALGGYAVLAHIYADFDTKRHSAVA